MSNIVKNLYQCFLERDCLNLTLNPLVLTTDNRLTPLHCSVEIDDSAVFRQQELFAMQDYTQVVYQERVGLLCDQNYIHLEGDGNIGVISNSSGLSLATNDLIQLYGGKSANFLDLSGQASREQIEEMIHLLNQDPNIKVILINCYGGTMHVDLVASAMALLFKHFDFNKPIVARLQGEGADSARS
jgi:succinyl-CoA synthetase beta subunit